MSLHVIAGDTKPKAVSTTLSLTDYQILDAKAKQKRTTISTLIREAMYQQGLLDP